MPQELPRRASARGHAAFLDHQLKELRPRPGRDVAIRILFVFDPWSQAVPLVAGNKAGDWTRWYEQAIAVAEIAYEGWLAVEGNGGRADGRLPRPERHPRRVA
ncbi:type II toxin-antitoxin system RelE/ParE family toxin [Micromonospora sp. NPDC050397]|uniref:type II toxin-antitoxin system RelE/ParE family toxin n=1 Tax=Micromonospora sp. NPDC050397 TaxID=3364279 RepID=UPI00384CDE7F